jgi:non-specific serine/threonine protein kinase/serine/threonine-protein kinase
MTKRSDPPLSDPSDEEATRPLGNETVLDVEGQPIRTRLPGFEIVRELGRGGMGQVLLARQTEPVERDVAIKLILQKIRSTEIEQRFLVERQALAGMHHPAIAQIFEAGTNPDGFPYFAMEYVSGLPINRFCAEHRLDLEQRIKLFIRVLNGVQHAHQKGIVHRDLKPANILVSWIDNQPAPKIIDFGIATAASPEHEHSSESSAGTPVYMSPEQFSTQPGIDTRADVYSLGVILCELLCDHRPWPREAFRKREPAEIHRYLTTHPPRLPSRSLVLASDHAEAIAQRRRMSLRRLQRRLNEELDAIAGRSIAIDREDRYGSASALADDLHRFLGNHPIRALDGGKRYRIGKFVARNRLALAGVGGVIGALAVGLGLALMAMIEAREQQRLAEARQNELSRMVEFQQTMLGDLDPQAFGQGLVDGLREQYRQSVAREHDLEAEAVDMAVYDQAVGRASPTDLARELIDEFMLRRAVSTIESEFDGQPLLQADLFETVQEVYRSTGIATKALGLAQRVVELRERELESDATGLLEARQDLAWALFQNGRFESARQTLDEVLARADLNRPEQRALVRSARNQLAIVLTELAEYDEALALAEHLLERNERDLGEFDAATLQALNTLGYVHGRSGRPETALGYYQTSLERARQVAEPGDRAVYGAMLNVGAALGVLDRQAEALAVESEVLEILTRELGRRNSATLRVMNNMASTLIDLDRLDEARPLLDEVVALRTETLGPQHPLTLGSRLNRGRLLLQAGDPSAALAQFLDVVDWRRRQLSPDHLDTLSAVALAAEAALAAGQPDRAQTLARQAYEGRKAALDAGHPQILEMQLLMADIHRERANLGLEVEWRQRYLDGVDRTDSPKALRAALSEQLRQYESLVALGMFDRADALALELKQGLEQAEGETPGLEQRFDQAVRERLAIQTSESR